MWKTGSLPLLAVVISLLGCDTDISSASQLRRPRLLAVQAEPPNPGFGQSTRLRPLVYLPPGETVTYEWSWCPMPTSSEDGYQCPIDQAAADSLAALVGLRDLPPLFLGTDETIAFTNPFPAALLASLCAGDSTTTNLFLGSASAGESERVYNCAIATLPVQIMLRSRHRGSARRRWFCTRSGCSPDCRSRSPRCFSVSLVDNEAKTATVNPSCPAAFAPLAS